jgi:hypothetical protein
VGVGVWVWSGLRAEALQSANRAAQEAIQAFRKPKAAPPRLLAKLADARITESSGLAASRTTPGVLWTHNDSGDGPYLFAIDRKGNTLARYRVPKADNVDWEDIAIATGADGKSILYIGDIGDNHSRRSDTAVYRVAEPVVDTTKTMQELKTGACEKLPYRYPDGPHDAETLMVSPKTGEIFIVTKVPSGESGVYSFPMPLKPGVTVTLNRLVTITFKAVYFKGKLAQSETLATAGDIAPDGRSLVIRTYLTGYEWKIAPGQSVAEALKGAPILFSLPLTRQGEAICYSADGKSLYIDSEGLHTPLYELPRP